MKGPASRPKVGFVLSGGGSRGAYEAGIIHYLRTDLAKRLGRHVPIDIVSGTSVGVINAAFLASTMADPDSQAVQIASAWKSLRIEELIGLRPRDVMRGMKMLLGGAAPPPAPGSFRYGGLLDTSGLEKFVIRTIPWRGIDRSLRSRSLHSISVSATHVGTMPRCGQRDRGSAWPCARGDGQRVDRRGVVRGQQGGPRCDLARELQGHRAAAVHRDLGRPAQIIGWGDRIGRITAGYQADLMPHD